MKRWLTFGAAVLEPGGVVGTTARGNSPMQTTYGSPWRPFRPHAKSLGHSSASRAALLCAHFIVSRAGEACGLGKREVVLPPYGIRASSFLLRLRH
jgi:hypothetical protein